MDYKEYTPGVHKLLHHLKHLDNAIKGFSVAPIHISVWPTNSCQLNCSYCCCRKMDRDGEELDIELYKNAISVLSKYGTKAIEWSGGGSPLLWPYLSEAVDFTHKLGIKQSLITNGLALKDISIKTLSKFAWIRISVQSVEHAKKINFERIPVKTSLSYIVPNNTDDSVLTKLYEFARRKKITVRIATQKPCSERRATIVEDMTNKLGDPLFFSGKILGQAKGCYMAWIRAAIDWRGNFLPCPAIQLSDEFDGLIPDNFILCNIKDIEKWILDNRLHDLGYNCAFCNCGKEENDFIHELLKEVIDVEFV